MLQLPESSPCKQQPHQARYFMCVLFLQPFSPQGCRVGRGNYSFSSGLLPIFGVKSVRSHWLVIGRRGAELGTECPSSSVTFPRRGGSIPSGADTDRQKGPPLPKPESFPSVLRQTLKSISFSSTGTEISPWLRNLLDLGVWSQGRERTEPEGRKVERVESLVSWSLSPIGQPRGGSDLDSILEVTVLKCTWVPVLSSKMYKNTT